MLLYIKQSIASSWNILCNLLQVAENITRVIASSLKIKSKIKTSVMIN